MGLLALFNSLDFQKVEGEGSRVTLANGDVVIKLHKPHPQKEVRAYAVKQVKKMLDDEGFI
jgi:hypothetical protein